MGRANKCLKNSQLLVLVRVGVGAVDAVHLRAQVHAVVLPAVQVVHPRVTDICVLRHRYMCYVTKKYLLRYCHVWLCVAPQTVKEYVGRAYVT